MGIAPPLSGLTWCPLLSGNEYCRLSNHQSNFKEIPEGCGLNRQSTINRLGNNLPYNFLTIYRTTFVQQRHFLKGSWYYQVSYAYITADPVWCNGKVFNSGHRKPWSEPTPRQPNVLLSTEIDRHHYVVHVVENAAWAFLTKWDAK